MFFLIKMIALLSIISYLYLAIIYTKRMDKYKLLGLTLLAVCISLYIVMNIFNLSFIFISLSLLLGISGLLLLIRPAIKNTFHDDFSFLEGLSLSMIASSYLVNLLSLFIQS